MFKEISFKGVIIGAIADVGGSNIWGLIAAIAKSFRNAKIRLEEFENYRSKGFLVLGCIG
jgi:hypothetical protein